MNALLLLVPFACDNVEPSECAETAMVEVFTDADNDGYGAPNTEKLVCEVRRGFTTNNDDCDDFRAAVNPGQIEECDGIDNDCDNQADEGLREQIFYLDADGDEFGDPDVEKATTSCAPPPGYVDNRSDCDDSNAGINPDALEVCDAAIDNNCNNLIDDQDPSLDLETAPTYYYDNDQDGFGDSNTTVTQCSQPGPDYVLNGDDCDDEDRDVNPNATEICNKYDDNCDQLIDDSDPTLDPSEQSEWFADADLDGAGDPNSTTLACFQPWFYVDNNLDCDDDEPLIQLPAPWVQDNDQDGYGAGVPSADSCTAPAADWVLLVKGFDCDDTNLFISPAGDEVCDGDDNDCDGLTDDDDPSLNPDFSLAFYRDFDNDGYGDALDVVQACSPPPMYVQDDTDCIDNNPQINPGATEVCDGADNDCDDDIDDEDDDVDLGTAGVWYADFDMDGFGDPTVSIGSCGQPVNYVDNNLDCDDTLEEQLVFGPWLEDVDGDGVGAGTPSPSSCVAPMAGWVPSYYGIDCGPLDPTQYPGNIEICNNGNDEDCDGFDMPCRLPDTDELYELFWSELIPGQGVVDAPERWLESLRD